MAIYTRKGDDGTTGLLHGGRVSKASPIPDALGAIDEAQAAIGVARAHSDGRVREILTMTAADLWVVMAEIAENPDRAQEQSTDLTARTASLERTIDDLTARFEMPTDFVVPGDNPLSAYIDVARATVRRAERAAIRAESGSDALVYLNRLSDVLWALARWTENDSTLAKKASDSSRK